MSKPLVVRSPDGSVADVLQTNDKGFKKSIEQSALWILHVETGRLLPYRDGTAIASLTDRGAWYEAVLAGAEASAAEHAPPQQPAGGPAVHQGAVGEEVLPKLYALIESRKRDLPEGSYTTYLFNEGIEKIKKKTGEEAIELLLAATHEEQIHEAADLIYHLLVLLVEAGMGFDELLAELRAR